MGIIHPVPGFCDRELNQMISRTLTMDDIDC